MNRTTFKLVTALSLVVLAVVLTSPARMQGNKQLQTTQVMQDYAKRELTAPPAVRQKLTELRQRIKQRNLGFEVGYTYAMERSARSMTGGQLDPNIVQIAKKQNVLARQVIQIDREARDQAIKLNPNLRLRMPEFTIACNANSKTFDWRWSGKVTPVRIQGCGNCWAYGAMAPLESSYLIRNNLTVDGSEQFIVSNSGAGNCEKGGSAKGAVDFLVATGTTTEANLPDSGTDGTPDVNDFTKPYQALVSGFVSDTEQIPSVAEIKSAMCEHGAVVSWVGVTDSFMSYTGGVYKDDDYANEAKKPCPSSGPINGAVCGHFVTIIGWSDPKHAWLVKNSWGTNWGETGGFGTDRGYMWIDYGSNQIGAGAMWEEARNNFYRLPHGYFELMHVKDLEGPVTNPNDKMKKPGQTKP